MRILLKLEPKSIIVVVYMMTANLLFSIISAEVTTSVLMGKILS
jgi:hypothetical protein